MPKRRRRLSKHLAWSVTALACAVTAACAAGRGDAGPASTDSESAALARADVEAPADVSLAKGCTPSGPERCFDATDDNCNGIVDEGCGVSTGLLQFAVAWDKPAADVDLEVTDPNGELAELERVSRSGLVKERDCPGRNNECQGQNLENVYLEGSDVTRGTYEVKVRLEKLGSDGPPVEVSLGARVGPKTYRARLSLEAAGAEKVLVFRL